MNLEQRAAATAPCSYIQIVAGPGTGKTFTLIKRMEHLLRLGLEPSLVVVMTFTNQAASEIRARVGIVKSDLPLVSTFHKVAIRIMKDAGGLNFAIASQSDQRSILREILADVDCEFLSKRQTGESTEPKPKPSTSKLVDKVIGIISRVKCLAASSEETEMISAILEQYNTELKRRNFFDFDDILKVFYDYMIEDPPSEVGSKIQQFVNRIQGVLVDEFQDTSLLQLKIADQLAKASGNLTVVGDPDQSIYGFRSARPENFEHMLKDHPSCQTYFLEQNYRSTGGILKVAEFAIGRSNNRLFQNSRNLKATTQLSSSPYLVSGTIPSGNRHFEAMSRQIHRLIDSGVSHNEIAVLARQRRHLAPLEAKLRAQRIAVNVVGGSDMKSRRCISLILDYMRVIHSDNDDMAIKRVINVPSRRIGIETLKKLQANNTILTISSLKRQQNDGVTDFLRTIESLRMLCNSGVDLEEVVARICEILWPGGPDEEEEVYVKAFTDSCKGVPGALLGQTLENWALDTQAPSKDRIAVTLSTIHSAKGLEWPVVYVLLCSNGQPSGQVVVDEEVRLLYVALTRACVHLLIYHESPHPSLSESSKALKRVTSVDQASPDYGLLSAYLKRPIKRPRPTFDDVDVDFISAIDLPIDEPTPNTMSSDLGRMQSIAKRHKTGSVAKKYNSTTKTQTIRQASVSDFFKKNT